MSPVPFSGTLDKAISSDFASGGIQMVADFMDHRPSPEGAPASPLWLRPTAALDEISAFF